MVDSTAHNFISVNALLIIRQLLIIDTALHKLYSLPASCYYQPHSGAASAQTETDVLAAGASFVERCIDATFAGGR